MVPPMHFRFLLNCTCEIVNTVTNCKEKMYIDLKKSNQTTTTKSIDIN